MIFSGVVRSYRCPTCEKNYSSVLPTSVIPMLTVVVIAGCLWSSLIEKIVGMRLVSILLGVGLAVASVAVIFVFLERFTDRWLTTRTCPRCNVKLESVGGGFVDGTTPTKQELLMYLLILGLPLLGWGSAYLLTV
ncbi:MAG: hypothetical protein KDD70_02595 [Bdellovibrionales bacterium]|nr:hypothetical protein [Bdellovibrionales bacterium]